MRETGLLLGNLGTPDEPTVPAVRRYLREFLWDRRVVDAPRLLWWLILNGIILRRRPARSAEAYRKIWTPEGSPLLAITARIGEGLEQRLSIPVAVGMRYGNPSLASALEELSGRGCRRILVLPLYPQYSRTTSASTMDAVAAARRADQEVRAVPDYYSDDGYIAALAGSVREFWRENGEPERLLASFHGLPRRYVEQGDPYRDQCMETARLLAAALRLPPERMKVCFQSRFGREEWLRPYTDETLEEWGRARLSSVDVICPGFGADCLETLEEIAIANRELFERAGGGRYRYIPALNDRPPHVDALASIVTRSLSGWAAAT